MTPRQRLLAVLHGELPDCVPCCPDISNMVPCRRTGKPFWDIYAYQDPPLWKAHINAIKHYDIDGGFELSLASDPLDENPPAFEDRVVWRADDGRFATQRFYADTGRWGTKLTVYTADNPPAVNVSPDKLHLPPEPTEWQPLTGVKQWPTGMELWRLVRTELGDHGILGVRACQSLLLCSPEDVYSYYDDPQPWRELARERIRQVEQRMEKIAAMNPRPDFLFCGASGSLVFQTPQIYRELSLPILQRTTELAYELGIPTHIHSCGPERELVKMAAEETRLTIIDPLEIPPMGDCDLAELKRLYGAKIVLKGNLHTTQVMLRGSVDDVVAASRQAIDDAGAGGGFILSTGDQCGRDTPDENIRAMVDTARTYGRYG